MFDYVITYIEYIEYKWRNIAFKYNFEEVERLKEGPDKERTKLITLFFEAKEGTLNSRKKGMK